MSWSEKSFSNRDSLFWPYFIVESLCFCCHWCWMSSAADTPGINEQTRKGTNVLYAQMSMNVHRWCRHPISPIEKLVYKIVSWNSHGNTGQTYNSGLPFAAVTIVTEAKVKDRKSVSSFCYLQRNIFNLCIWWIIFCALNWLTLCDNAIWMKLIYPVATVTTVIFFLQITYYRVDCTCLHKQTVSVIFIWTEIDFWNRYNLKWILMLNFWFCH